MENENLIRKRFESTRTEEQRATDKRGLLTISINDEEKEKLKLIKNTLQQEKESTALKQLAMIGYAFVRNENPQGLLATYVKENMRRNKRWGLLEVE